MMLKITRLSFGWKYLLCLILLTSIHTVQASTLSIGNTLLLTNKNKIPDPVEINTSLFSTPIILIQTLAFDEARLVSGDPLTRIGYVNQTLSLNQRGVYKATLTDFKFPAAFDLLGLTITSSTKKMGEIWNSGNFDFDAAAGEYYLGLVYRTSETLNLGMYGVNLRYIGTSAVPLPASLWLMITGIMAILGYRRKPR